MSIVTTVTSIVVSILVYFSLIPLSLSLPCNPKPLKFNIHKVKMSDYF